MPLDCSFWNSKASKTYWKYQRALTYFGSTPFYTFWEHLGHPTPKDNILYGPKEQHLICITPVLKIIQNK